MKTNNQLDKSPQHFNALLQNYNHTILQTTCPEWYAYYNPLTAEYNPDSFSLKGKLLAERLSSLVLSAERRLFWALNLPPLPQSERHHILQALAHVKNKGFFVFMQFCPHSQLTTSHTLFFCQNKRVNKIKQSYHPNHFNFMISDDSLLFEEPASATQGERGYFFIKKSSNTTIEKLISDPRFSCSKSNIKTFINS
jgi:hypothetical protein